MRFASLMQLTGADRQRFNSLRRRCPQLPFLDRAQTGEDLQTVTLEEALWMRLMLMLGAGESSAGISLENAQRLIEKGLSNTQNGFAKGLRELITTPATWIGCVEFEGVTRCGASERWAAHFAGPIDSLSNWMFDAPSEGAAGYRRRCPTRIIGLVNVSAAAEYVLEKADNFGVPVGAWEARSSQVGCVG